MRYLSLLIIFFLISCSHVPEKPEIKGTIYHIGLEGGFYGIIDEVGNRYDPVNLDPGFHENGMKVIFTGTPCEECASFHMWGQLFKLESIKKQESGS